MDCPPSSQSTTSRPPPSARRKAGCKLGLFLGVLGFFGTLAIYLHVAHLSLQYKPRLENEVRSFLEYIFDRYSKEVDRAQVPAHRKWWEESDNALAEVRASVVARFGSDLFRPVDPEEAIQLLTAQLPVPPEEARKKVLEAGQDSDQARERGMKTKSLIVRDVLHAAYYFHIVTELRAGEVLKTAVESDWSISDEGKRKISSSPLTKHRFQIERVQDHLHLSAGPVSVLVGSCLAAIGLSLANRRGPWPIAPGLFWTLSVASGILLAAGHILIREPKLEKPNKAPVPITPIPLERSIAPVIAETPPFSNTTKAATPELSNAQLRSNARAQAQEISDALLRGDYKAVIGAMPLWVLEFMGGAETAERQLRSVALSVIGSITVHPVNQVATFGSEALAIIPTTQRMNIEGTPARLEGYLLGFSSDGGRRWTFMSGSDAASDMVKQKFAHLAIDLKFPERRQFLEKPGEPVMEMVEVEGEWLPVGAFRDRVARAARKIEEGNALYERGRKYYIGEGVAKDWDEAFKWFQKAEEAGHLRGQVTLGICYLRGKGTKADPGKAVEYFRKAALRDYAPGQVRLADCYRLGEGVPLDLAQAKFWYTKAANQGDVEAKKALDEFDR